MKLLTLDVVRQTNSGRERQIRTEEERHIAKWKLFFLLKFHSNGDLGQSLHEVATQYISWINYTVLFSLLSPIHMKLLQLFCEKVSAHLAIM